MRYSCGIDIGGTKIAGVLVDEKLNVLLSERIFYTCKGPDRVVEEIASLVDYLTKDIEKSKLLGIGIVTPGIIDSDNGVVVYAANLNWRDVPVRNLLEKRLGLPCLLEHDVKGGALAELFFGAGREFRDFLYVSVGTGIAGAIVWDRKVVKGSHNICGEIGHTVVMPQGPMCRCGKRGCLEALASGSAMEREAWYLAGEEVEGSVIVERAESGDPLFREILRNASFYLGLALANMAGVLDPEAIILGGGVSEAGLLWFSFVEEAYRMHLLDLNRAPKLLLGVFRGRASVMGAAALPLLGHGSLL
ncbi:MAG: ROK family protein [Candidatus Caldatribacterium sp.]|nr:ROK family protein [Candidatus Caldatribacterium sp.]